MRNAGHRIFPLNFDSLRPLHFVRATASVLAVVLLGNSVALAAGAPKVKTAMDPAKLKQALTTRGIGKSVKVTELDGTTVSGSLTAIRDDAFDVTLKKATQPTTISYPQVSKEGNGGLSTGAKIGIGVSCVVVVAAVVAIVFAVKFKGVGGIGPINLGPISKKASSRWGMSRSAFRSPPDMI